MCIKSKINQVTITYSTLKERPMKNFKIFGYHHIKFRLKESQTKIVHSAHVQSIEDNSSTDQATFLGLSLNVKGDNLEYLIQMHSTHA